MGQDSSSLRLVDDSDRPEKLQSRTLSSVAKYIKDGRAKKIVVLTGAGISTSAGIPDFRSPETGLYANLARLDLPYAEAVFDISYFRQNPEPFYVLAHELFPGSYRPTITHSFIALLNDKGLLLKLFTQNIDCLEREAGVTDDMIVEAHGSFATQRCIECATPYDDGAMKEAISNKNVPKCERCKGLVKPDIVFFGEGLPAKFFESREVIAQADLAIIMGTSLSVAPFAHLPQLIQDNVPRLLINMERVGDLGTRLDDVIQLGACDDGIRELARELGWLQELEEKWAQTAPIESAEAKRLREDAEVVEEAKSQDEKLEDEVLKLTQEIEKALQIGNRGIFFDQPPKQSTTRRSSGTDIGTEARLKVESLPASKEQTSGNEEKSD